MELRLLSNDLIILGDFNWNIILDKKAKPSLAGNFQDVNTILNFYDMVSAYHHHFNEKFGEEKNPTFFHTRNKDKKYHTDYIFLKKNKIIDLKYCFVGQYGEWNRDHMPLLIEI